MARNDNPEILSFDFVPGRVLARRYEVLSLLGRGWEGEVYLLRETQTGIERAAKFFFPQRNPRNKTIHFHARKLHKLRTCPALIPYHTLESVTVSGLDVSFLISDFVEGEALSAFLARQPQRRLDPFQSLHLLHALVTAVEGIHQLGDYHGDLHPGNVIVRRLGLGFEVKLLDFFHWGAATNSSFQDEVVDVIRIFYDAVGGKDRYARLPAEAKAICLGLKRTLILKKFATMTALREHLESMVWDETYH